MNYEHTSMRKLSLLLAGLTTIGLFSLLILLSSFWSPVAKAAENGANSVALSVLVDGRAVSVESIEAQLQGATSTYTEVIKFIGPDPVTTDQLEIFSPPDTPITGTQGTAVVHGREINLTNLSQTVASHGRIGVWISGNGWRICVIIVWGSQANLDVSVDGREVTVDGLEAQLEGQPTTLPQLIATLGSDPIAGEKIELFDPAQPDVTKVVTEGVQAILHGNQLQLTGLSREVALRGRIGIWVSGRNWRICVIIVWGNRANLDVTVDGREVKVEGSEAQIDGQPTEVRRVLAMLDGTVAKADKVELFDPATPSNTKVVSNVVATLEGSHLSLTGLAPELAARGRIGIWVSGSRWRICIIIVWGDRANLDVTVDGRAVKVEGSEAQIDGQPTEVRRVLYLLDGTVAKADKVELFDPATPSNTKVVSNVVATLEGSHLSLTGLAPELAARGRIGIWVSGSRWRICIIIVWGDRTNLDVTVDGREVKVEGSEAQIDGQPTEVRRVLYLLDGTVAKADKVELFDPATPSNTKVVSNVVATLEGSHLSLTGLAPELAARGRIGIWVSGSRWRICIIIVWGSKANLDVTVDGRAVKVEGSEAQIDGQPTEVRRVLALLGDAAVKADKVELFDPATPSNTKVVSDVVATLEGSHLSLTGLAPELAARGRIGIWVSGSRWRICIIIVWGDRTNLDVTVDGRDIKVESTAAEIDGAETELRRVLELLGNEPIAVETIEIFKPAATAASILTDPIIITPTQAVSATITGSLVRFEGLANTLALHKRIGIWISGSRWRICIIITLGSDNTPRVVVDGRAVLAYHPVAEFDGEKVDPRRVLAFLSEQEVTAEKLEIEADGQAVTDADATAQIKEGRIIFTNLKDTLAAKGRISVWISGKRWKICVTIEWGIHRSPDGQVNVDLPASDAHAGITIDYTEVPTPTHTLPQNKRKLILFALDATNSLGGIIHQLDEDYTVEVTYTDEALEAAGIDEATLKIYVFDEATGAWIAIPTEVDTVNNKATGMLDHFSEFGLLGDEASSSTEQSIFLPIVHK